MYVAKKKTNLKVPTILARAKTYSKSIINQHSSSTPVISEQNLRRRKMAMNKQLFEINFYQD
jgi:hypothetical protein